MAEYRFFKCNVLGGFRLSDLNKNVKQAEYFYVDSHVAETSRAVIAALRDRWMVEVSEKEASKSISIPRAILKGGVQTTQIRKRGAVNQSANLAIPNIKEVNKNIESRQTEKNKLDKLKPAIPDFTKSVETIKKRQADSMNKTSASTDKEIGKELKDTEKVAGPDLKIANKDLETRQAENNKQIEKEEPKQEEEKKVEEKQEETKQEEKKVEEKQEEEKQEETKQEEKQEETKQEEKQEEPKQEEEKKVEVNEIKEDDTIKALSNDDAFDNSQLATPNFDERKAEAKKEIKQKLDKKIQRKKRKYTRRKKTDETKTKEA